MAPPGLSFRALLEGNWIAPIFSGTLLNTSVGNILGIKTIALLSNESGFGVGATTSGVGTVKISGTISGTSVATGSIDGIMIDRSGSIGACARADSEGVTATGGIDEATRGVAIVGTGTCDKSSWKGVIDATGRASTGVASMTDGAVCICDITEGMA